MTELATKTRLASAAAPVGHSPLLGRSVFTSQSLLAGSLLVLVGIIAAVQPAVLGDSLFFLGVVLILAMTGLAAALPWQNLPKALIAVLPLVDVVAICMLRQSQPTLGASLLLVFPVIWLATHFGSVGAVGGVLLATTLIWGGAALREAVPSPEEVPRLAAVPIMLAFVAATTFGTTRRSAAQRVLLRQQAGLFEAALRRSTRQEQTLDEIFNAVDFGVVGFDASGKPNLINRAQREVLDRFRVPPGQAVPDVVYGDDKLTPIHEAHRPFRRALRGESVDRETVWFDDPGRARSAFLVSARPLTDEHGVFDGGVIVLRDVTAELKAIQARDDLVASVSHELRTPLTSILGYLELALDDERLEPGTRHMLEVTSKNADRLLALVADLLTAASNAKNTLLLAFEPCELSSILADAVESARPLADERFITFEVAPMPRLLVNADAFRLRQVADNVLSNAVKYNVASGHITVTLEPTDAGAELRVTDTGRGMTPDEQTHLFDRFYRADSVRGSSVHGTGLGLNISRDIMRQHGGDLRLESTFGTGTTAIATLPIAAPPTESPRQETR
ncbi:sensor histidine kinase [Glaciibacter sp. 2TAF33]|uniref:sensor histidine kinase n=1 Tax=Glaciibacter sp. 2TAF33 TaxID=3233015 RepID=UPI003F93A47A